MPKKLKLKGPCLSCARGFHAECEHRCKRCHTTPEARTYDDEPKEEKEIKAPKERKSKVNDLKDESSTGRKRAAELYPINPDDACEWQGKRNCGGGRRPIVGCLEGKQQHRHHGPVKRTIRNEEGNLHRICTACHVHWHELNDLVYDEKDYNSLPHMPIEATQEELVLNLLAWKDGSMGRQFELASSKNKAKFNDNLKEE